MQSKHEFKHLLVSFLFTAISFVHFVSSLPPCFVYNRALVFLNDVPHILVLNVSVCFIVVSLFFFYVDI